MGKVLKKFDTNSELSYFCTPLIKDRRFGSSVGRAIHF